MQLSVLWLWVAVSDARASDDLLDERPQRLQALTWQRRPEEGAIPRIEWAACQCGRAVGFRGSISREESHVTSPLDLRPANVTERMWTPL